MSEPHILMCPPDFFGIEYEINPWMNRNRNCDHALAVEQWNALHALLLKTGARVSTLSPVAGLPDLVFTANAALIHRQTAVLSHFRHPQRQGEESIDQAWLESAGFQVETLDVETPGEGFYFEGAGDALYCGDTLFAGYRIRSDMRAHQRVAQIVDSRVIALELVDEHFYHLDTCFCPLAPGRAIYYPGAFDSYGRKALAEYVEELIPVNAAEAKSFACNAVVVGKTVVTNVGCPELHRDLGQRGFDPWQTPLGEFVKSGGSAKCLTLRLDGEEAAAWKHENAGA
jgi:N-dimethylarginine dimethylaminohydrolase